MKRLSKALVYGVAALCLGANAAGAATTDAKDNEKTIAPVKIIVAQESVADVGLDIKAVCQGKTVLFTFHNVGDPWPAVANIKVFKVSDKTLLFHRSMRMTKLQKASFKLPAKKNPGGAIGLFIEPSWMMRSFTIDAKASCD